MAITLPIGIRIAAGLLGSTIDRIGRLPAELPTLGVSLAGQAVRTSFRIRQEIAELATRGDELLAGITGRPEEKPPWATFDEDESDEPATPEPTTPEPAKPEPSLSAPATPPPAAATPTSTPTTPTSARATRKPAPTTPKPAPTTPRTAKSARPSAKTASPVTVPVPSNRIRQSRVGSARGTAPGTASAAAAPAGTASAATPAATAAAFTAAAAASSTAGYAAGSPAIIAGDHPLTIAQLKQELQSMDIAAVRELLLLEETGPNRAAYLTLLSNRLTTLAHENEQSEGR